MTRKGKHFYASGPAAIVAASVLAYGCFHPLHYHRQSWTPEKAQALEQIRPDQKRYREQGKLLEGISPEVVQEWINGLEKAAAEHRRHPMPVPD